MASVCMSTGSSAEASTTDTGASERATASGEVSSATAASSSDFSCAFAVNSWSLRDIYYAPHLSLRRLPLFLEREDPCNLLLSLWDGRCVLQLPGGIFPPQVEQLQPRIPQFVGQLMVAQIPQMVQVGAALLLRHLLSRFPRVLPRARLQALLQQLPEELSSPALSPLGSLRGSLACAAPAHLQWFQRPVYRAL